MFPAPIFGLLQQPLQEFRKEDTMYKTANTLPEKIRSKSVAALLVGLVALTALSMTPPTASAANPPGSYQQSEHEGRAIDSSRRGPGGYWVYIPQYHTPHGIYVGDSEHQKP